MALPHAVIIGTGPSLSGVTDLLHEGQAAGKFLLFGPNDTFLDFELDVWLACDPEWHKRRGPVFLEHCEQWHWDKDICAAGNYRHIEGGWFDGLSTEDYWISYGHSSGWQLLNLARHYHEWGVVTAPILLVGFDMKYEPGKPRHYFKGLSDQDGEYEPELRKHSAFAKPDKTGLLYDYRHIADQVADGKVPQIVNCTPGSAMTWFPIRELADYL